MDLMQFHRMRTAIQVNTGPSPTAELVKLERSLRVALQSSGLFREVEVEHTDDNDRLVIALCTFGPDVSAADVGRRLEQMWDERVRLPFWEAHALLPGEEIVELEAATRGSLSTGYVTVHLVAQKVTIPAQRTAAEKRESVRS